VGEIHQSATAPAYEALQDDVYLTTGLFSPVYHVASISYHSRFGF